MLGFNRRKEYVVFYQQENDGFKRVRKRRIRANKDTKKYGDKMYFIDHAQNTCSHRNKTFFYVDVTENIQLNISERKQSVVDEENRELEKEIDEKMQEILDLETNGVQYIEGRSRYFNKQVRDPEMFNFFVGKKTIKQIIGLMVSSSYSLLIIGGIMGLVGGVGIGWILREMISLGS